MLKLFPASSQVPLQLPAESDSRYPVVAQLSPRWRVIECRHQIQWVLQRRHGPGGPESTLRATWDGRSYRRTKDALIRCCREHAGELDPSALLALAALPARIGGGL
jgi:hypothetical protein